MSPAASPARLLRPPTLPASAGPPSPPPGGPDVGRWWKVGEPAAAARAELFAGTLVGHYAHDRDRPDLPHTSELSPALAWGEISPGQVVAAVRQSDNEDAAPFIRQLIWREFSYHVLHHFPDAVDLPLRARFSAFPWRIDGEMFDAWKSGRTGYPLVDAGMRQLAATGWIHNRVRMVCGSFLTKHLLQPWQLGAAHFEARLVDYDTAANTFNWQWVAGCGADAAPYFRIFNPTVQGQRHDPEGAYIRRWVPELARLPLPWLHHPWEAPLEALRAAGVSLDLTYPRPIVDHSEARARALAAYAAI